MDNIKTLKKYIFISVLEGFALMLFEMFGTRIINSYFGNSLNVWITCIVMTLLGLSIGYYFGGKLSKKSDNIDSLLYKILNCFSLSLVLVLLFSNLLFKQFSGLSFNFSLFLCSSLIIVPPVLLLGLISPLLIFKISEDNSKTSFYMAKIYAISTFSGIISVLLAAYFLMEYVGISWSFILLSIFIIIFSSTIFKKKAFITFRNVSLIALLATIAFQIVNKKESDEYKIAYESEGVYGQVKVLDQLSTKLNLKVRRLLINGISQTFILNSPEAYSFWHYPHIISGFVSQKEKSSKTLLLGLGGGSIARELQQQNFKFDAVELDQRIIDLSEEYFYLKPKGINIIQGDARNYIKTVNKKYDLIIYDVLSGENQPNYMFTKESLNELKRIIHEKSLIVINFQGFINSKKDLAFKALYKTFKHAGFKTHFWAGNPNDFDDIVFAISLSEIDLQHYKPENVNECCRQNIKMKNWFTNPVSNIPVDTKNVPLLTDDNLLLENLNREAKMKWRNNMTKEISLNLLNQNISLFK